jgi:hypothetical protein
VNPNTTAASEHLQDIERYIRLIKEGFCAILNTLQFKRIPGRVIIDLVNYVVMWLNAFPPASGVSKMYIPRTIMTGTSLDFNKHCKKPFGEYAESHEDTIKTNTMVARTQGTICLGPSSNFQGSYKLLALNSGRKITRK